MAAGALCRRADEDHGDVRMVDINIMASASDVSKFGRLATD